MSDRLKVLLQHLLPKQRLTTFAGRVAGAQRGWMTTRLIRWFVGKYGVDMNEAADTDIASYKSFNDFFTRPLKAGVRPLATADFVCPVDGAISQFGAIDDHHILQAKGHRFSTTELLGGAVRFGPDRPAEACERDPAARSLQRAFLGNVDVAIGANRDIALFAGRFGAVRARLER